MRINFTFHTSTLLTGIVAVTLFMTGCRSKSSSKADVQQSGQPSAAVAQPVTEQEKNTQCISIERAIDIAQLVEISGTAVTGLRDADKIDAIMRSMGYKRSAIEEIYQVGRATMYTQGCDADAMGSMTHVRNSKATLVAIAGKGQPATAALVSISMADEDVWRELIHEMGTLGFQGTGYEMSNGHGYKIFYDRFLSGNGFLIQISRE